MLEYIHELYTNEIADKIFTFYLTIGSILYAAKPFVIFELKRNLFDNSFYIERYLDGDETNKYDPLDNIRKLLFLSILFSLSGAVLHFFIFNECKSNLLIIIYLYDILALIVIFSTIIVVHKNMSDLFNLYKDEEKNKHTKNKPAAKDGIEVDISSNKK